MARIPTIEIAAPAATLFTLESLANPPFPTAPREHWEDAGYQLSHRRDLGGTPYAVADVSYLVAEKLSADGHVLEEAHPDVPGDVSVPHPEVQRADGTLTLRGNGFDGVPTPPLATVSIPQLGPRDARAGERRSFWGVSSWDVQNGWNLLELHPAREHAVRAVDRRWTLDQVAGTPRLLAVRLLTVSVTKVLDPAVSWTIVAPRPDAASLSRVERPVAL